MEEIPCRRANVVGAFGIVEEEEEALLPQWRWPRRSSPVRKSIAAIQVKKIEREFVSNFRVAERQRQGREGVLGKDA